MNSIKNSRVPEYDRGTYREIKGLKRLAQLILDKRAELRRSGSSQNGEEEQNEGPVDVNGPEYHFGINFNSLLNNAEEANKHGDRPVITS